MPISAKGADDVQPDRRKLHGGNEGWKYRCGFRDQRRRRGETGQLVQKGNIGSSEPYIQLTDGLADSLRILTPSRTHRLTHSLAPSHSTRSLIYTHSFLRWLTYSHTYACTLTRPLDYRQLNWAGARRNPDVGHGRNLFSYLISLWVVITQERTVHHAIAVNIMFSKLGRSDQQARIISRVKIKDEIRPVMTRLPFQCRFWLQPSSTKSNQLPLQGNVLSRALKLAAIVIVTLGLFLYTLQTVQPSFRQRLFNVVMRSESDTKAKQQLPSTSTPGVGKMVDRQNVRIVKILGKLRSGAGTWARRRLRRDG